MQRVRQAGEELVRRVRAFSRRHWQGALIIREKLRLNEDALHLLLAGIVGVIGGATNLAYHACNQFIKWIFYHETGDFLEIAARVPPWKLIVVPTLGGLAAGLIIYFGLRLIGNPGLSNLLEVIVAGDGRLPLRSALISAASSVVSISTGASIGREGLIMQVTAAVSSKLGRVAKWPPYRLRLLVACGAAAGLAAGCNAPVAGAVFAAQIVLGNFSMNLFAPLVFSSVVASVIARNPLTPHAWVRVAEADFTNLLQLPWFLPLGIAAGFCGAGFLKLLRLSDEFTSKLSVPLYLRIMGSAAAVGAMALLFNFPGVLGNGHEATNEILGKDFPLPLRFLLGLFIAKFIATILTVSSGTVGGIFTPTLFLGAALGSLFAGCLHRIGWGPDLSPGVFALVGMGGLLAATTHSPLLAMIMIFELSLNYSVMPPLMLACVVATLVSRSFHPESVYTEPLRRKGLELTRESARLGAATEKTVGDIMQPPVPPLNETTTFQQISERFLTSPNNFLPVVDERGRLTGIVALHDLKNFLNVSFGLNGVIASDVMRAPPACLTPNQRLSDVLPVLLSSELRNVPVVNTLTEYKLIGAVARADALGTLSEAISASTTTEG